MRTQGNLHQSSTISASLRSSDPQVASSMEQYQVTEVRGRESIGELFDFTITLVRRSEGLAGALELESLLGVRVQLRIDVQDAIVNGIVAEARELGDPVRLTHHALQLRLVPSLWKMSLVRMQNLHLDVSVPEVIRRKLEMAELGEQSLLKLLHSYPKRELVMQYAESDLSFISRLCEHLGISFIFSHKDEQDLVIFVDDASTFIRVDTPLGREHSAEADPAFEVLTTCQLHSSIYGVDDYNYRTPQSALFCTHELKDGFGGGVLEYGTHHKNEDEGAWLAQVRAEEIRARQLVLEGKSDNPLVSAGHVFSLQHPRFDGQEILITEVEHELQQSSFGQESQEPPSYRNRFRAVPTDFTYRPPRRTAIPRMWGLATGVIEGLPGAAAGGFARLDSEGRYIVRFHFDNLGEGEDTKASHPVRMVQAFTGANEGMHFPLRPGTEVLMAFVNGDPDRPIIVGAAPNPLTRSPVTEVVSNRNRITTGSGIRLEMSDGK